jgi:hypothetical protein
MMMKQDWIVVSLSVILILLVVYLAWMFLQTQANLFLGIVLMWTILPPIFSNLPYSFKYALILPAPIFGAWYLFTVALLSLDLFSNYAIILATLLSLFVVYSFHLFTRTRVMFWKIPLASLTRTGMAAISAIFIPIGVMLMSSDELRLDMQNRIIFFAILLVAYVASSMLFVNSSYRYYVLSNRLKTYNMEKSLEHTWANIKKRFHEKEKDCELLQYYFSESLRAFLEGDYERSLIWGYKVIREPTVVDPTLYVDDKRLNKPSFSDVRNILEHSRRGGHVDTKKIRQIMGSLFDDSLDLVEREITLLKKIPLCGNTRG